MFIIRIMLKTNEPVLLAIGPAQAAIERTDPQVVTAVFQYLMNERAAQAGGVVLVSEVVLKRISIVSLNAFLRPKQKEALIILNGAERITTE